MTSTKLKTALGLAAGILAAGGATTVLLSGVGISDNLPAVEIFKKAQEAYASLTNYSDQGKTVSTVNGMNLTTAFTIKLARPNLYRIEWTQSSDSPFAPTINKPQSVWSAGDGDYLDMLGRGPQKQASEEAALSSATGISAGAAATIPGTFFKLNWGNTLGQPWVDAKRLGDEKVADVDCYVLSSEAQGRTKTLWIGKQDFLVRQLRVVASAEAMKAMMAQAAQSTPGIVLPTQQVGGLTSTETHSNIVVNGKFSPADFAH